MSGPKSGDYYYDAETDTRLINDQLERARQARVLLEGVFEEIKTVERRLGERLGLEVRVPEAPAAGVRLSAARIYQRAMTETLAAAKAALPGAIARVEMRQAMTRLTKDLATRAVTAAESLRDTPPKQAAPEATHVLSPQTIASKATDYLLRLRDDAPAAERRAIEAIGRTILAEASTGRAEALLFELSARIQQLNLECARHEKELRDVRVLLDDLARDDSEEASLLVESLRQIERGHAILSDELRARAERAVSAAQGRAKSTRVAEILEETLSELGYTVDEDFSTLSVDGGALYFRRQEWGDYSVQMNLHTTDSRLNMHLVRHGGPALPSVDQDREDRSMEERLCPEVEPLLARMKEHGLDVRLSRKELPGAVPMKVVAAIGSAPAPAPGRKKLRRKRSAERAHPAN